MAKATSSQQNGQEPRSHLAGPPPNPRFVEKLDQLVGLANQGQQTDSAFFNPPDSWLIERMHILQNLSEDGQNRLRQEAKQVSQDAVEANAAGKAAAKAGPNAVVRLNNGGLAFFSQLGVVRRPDLTQYFVDGFRANRDALAFSEENQELFTEVFGYINDYMRQSFASGEIIIQSDRRIGDAIGRSFHARQLLFGSDYLQLPYMWRQLTFDLPENEREDRPDIVEVSIPNWLRDLGMHDELKRRIQESGLTKLVFKAPTKGLSLHLGFDYVGEHKMGPLSIAMFQVKQADGLAVQAALSMARVRTLDGALNHTAVVTVGPSLHGKSTLTIMIELANSELGKLLGLAPDPEEGVYPMNDDIVLMQQLQEDVQNTRSGSPVRISYGIDGTENNFYAVPFGLTREDDPITYDVLRGTRESPNPQETLENVVVGTDDGIPDYSQNPVRNMRMVLSRPRLLSRKNASDLMKTITNGKISDSVHVPMQDTDRVIWQAVMRQNTIMPPLRRLNIEQYVRVLMFGEAVQMGAAIGAIGRPYVEYFSDPFIIGLEDENANLMLRVLRDMADGGLRQEYYAFNTGGVGADSNDEASGRLYKKISRELTLMLQEALLRGAVKFERDEVLGSDVAVAIVNAQGEKVVDLEEEWLPRKIYGEAEYRKRILVLNQRRYYGQDSTDKAGILRYTKVSDAVFDIDSIPVPLNERELAWLLSFYWGVDQAYDSLDELVCRLDEGRYPDADILVALQKKYEDGQAQGLNLGQNSRNTLGALGLKDRN